MKLHKPRRPIPPSDTDRCWLIVMPYPGTDLRQQQANTPAVVRLTVHNAPEWITKAIAQRFSSDHTPSEQVAYHPITDCNQCDADPVERVCTVLTPKGWTPSKAEGTT